MDDASRLMQEIADAASRRHSFTSGMIFIVGMICLAIIYICDAE